MARTKIIDLGGPLGRLTDLDFKQLTLVEPACYSEKFGYLPPQSLEVRGSSELRNLAEAILEFLKED